MRVMTSSMGAWGPDLLFELSNAKSVAPRVRTRALELTRTESVRKLATPQLRIALDLRDRGGCERQPLFPEAATTTMPAATALAMAVPQASVGATAAVYLPLPRLMLMATMLYFALFCTTQLMAARITEV